MDRIALLIRREEEFLFLKKDSEEADWTPITRQIEKGETLREAARNETRSVTGVEIEFVEKITKIDIGSENERIHWYLAGEASATEEEPEPEQVDVSEQSHEWFSSEELDELDIDAHTKKFLEEHSEKLLEK